MRASAAEALRHDFLSATLSVDIQVLIQNSVAEEQPTQLFDHVPERGLTEILNMADFDEMVNYNGMADFFGMPDFGEEHDAPATRMFQDRSAGPPRLTRSPGSRMHHEIRPAVISLPAASAVAFWKLEYKNQKIMYMAHRGLVNITHILRIYSRYKALSPVLKQLNIRKEIVKGGRGDRQGTYVSFDDA